MQNNTTSDVQQIPFLYIGAVHACLTSIGFSLNAWTFLAAFFVFSSTKNTFYLLILSLTLIDSIYLFETLFYSLPCAFMGRHIFGALVDSAVGHVDTLTWFGQCSHVFFMALNRLRFTCLASFVTFDKVYTVCNTLVWIVVLWMFSLGMAVSGLLGQCMKSFKLDGFYWSFDCVPGTASTAVNILNQAVSGFLPLASGLFYCIIWIIIRKRNRKIVAIQNSDNDLITQRRMKQEISIVVQFSMITGVLVLNYVSFWVVSNVFSAQLSTIIIQTVAILNASVNPIVYLMFNNSMNRQMKKLANCNWQKFEDSAVMAHHQ